MADPTQTRQATILAAALQLLEAVDFYANPDTYHAVMAIGDSPCGEFIRDVAPLTAHDLYVGYRGDGDSYYGRRAREAMAAWQAANQDVTDG
jgi:hypothetical protein